MMMDTSSSEKTRQELDQVIALIGRYFTAGTEHDGPHELLADIGNRLVDIASKLPGWQVYECPWNRVDPDIDTRQEVVNELIESGWLPDDDADSLINTLATVVPLVPDGAEFRAAQKTLERYIR